VKTLSKKTLVFGLGTGRCGTASLSKLLNSQENAFVGHELFPILPWNPNKSVFEFKFHQLNHQTHAYDLVGDVGMYYLPYITSLIYSFKRTHNVKFVIMERNIDEVVESYIEKFRIQGNNPLQQHDGSTWRLVPDWDLAFPKYSSNLSLEDAVYSYCRDYSRLSTSVKETHPENVEIFDMSFLNNEAGVNNILDFVGIKNKKPIINIKENITV
jgi:hypothetical protein